MQDKLSKILKDLRNINPDPDYTQKSRSLILSYRKELEAKPSELGLFWNFLKKIQSRQFALVSEIVGALIIVALVGFFYNQETNNNNLVVQADQINSTIQLKLNEITYLLKIQQTSPQKQGGVNKSLVKAAESLKQAQSDLKDNKISASLDNIKSAEVIFSSLEADLKQATSTNATSTNATSTDATSTLLENSSSSPNLENPTSSEK